MMIRGGGGVNRVRISVKTKILLVFLLLSVSALGVTGIVALVPIGDVSRLRGGEQQRSR
jgi:hypothetical protein